MSSLFSIESEAAARSLSILLQRNRL